jgi:hypothetical protein
MTRRTNARIAGFAYLFYIAVAFPSLMLLERATSGTGIAAKLQGIAQHAPDVRLAVVLSFAGCFAALVLAVTLWAITRDQDPDLAMLALICRVGEGVSGAVGIPMTLGLLWLATATGPEAPDPAAAQALGAFLLRETPFVSATFFAVGSTIFSWLLLRGRMVPVPLAWLGVVASVPLVVLLPLQLTVTFGGLIDWLMWMPMLVFEVTLALWLIIKGVATPA